MGGSEAVARLLAGLAEDERVAQAADHTRWLPEDKGVSFEHYDTESDYVGRVEADTKANMNHITHFGPRRILPQVEALRQLITLRDTAKAKCDENERRLDAIPGTQPINPRLLQEVSSGLGEFKAYEVALQVLASIYTEGTDEAEAL